MGIGEDVLIIANVAAIDEVHILMGQATELEHVDAAVDRVVKLGDFELHGFEFYAVFFFPFVGIDDKGPASEIQAGANEGRETLIDDEVLIIGGKSGGSFRARDRRRTGVRRLQG